MKDYTFTTPVRGVIFDCDGVILNSRAANIQYYNRILDVFGLPPMTPEQEAYTHMSTVYQALDSIIPPHLHDQLAHVCTETVNYLRDIMPLVELEDGLYDFVRWLHARGVQCAVHTNRSSGMAFVLDKFQLAPYFNPVVTAAMVAPKPAPDGVFYVEKCWDIPKEHLLFIGDSSIDANTAHAAGVRFAAYANPALAADITIATFSQLQTLLQAEGAL